MICQHCHTKPATTHIRTSINGIAEEKMLCSECAAKLGYNELSSMFTGGLLGSLLQNDLSGTTAAGAARCPRCGIRFEEVIHSGKVGCADCYKHFHELLTPMIEKAHGKASHAGKKPAGADCKPPKSTIDQLKEELARAIETQEFERAAILRDEIRAQEGSAQ